MLSNQMIILWRTERFSYNNLLQTGEGYFYLSGFVYTLTNVVLYKLNKSGFQGNQTLHIKPEQKGKRRSHTTKAETAEHRSKHSRTVHHGYHTKQRISEVGTVQSIVITPTLLTHLITSSLRQYLSPTRVRQLVQQ